MKEIYILHINFANFIFFRFFLLMLTIKDFSILYNFPNSLVIFLLHFKNINIINIINSYYIS